MKDENWIITKWCKSITDSGEDEYVNADKKKDTMIYDFRLLDDDGVIYAYGLSDVCDEESAFDPLDYYENIYGCTSIEYKNKGTGKYEVL